MQISNKHWTPRLVFALVAAAFIAGYAECKQLNVTECGPGSGKRLFRFVQWTDQHVSIKPSNYRLANEKQEYLVQSANRLKPDFVLSIGDMILGADSEAEMKLFDKMNAKLKNPLYPVIGNHETNQTEYDMKLNKAFTDAYGRDRANYTFEVGGILFIAMDNSGTPMTNTTNAGKRRREWLRRVLESAPDKPKIIACHIPLVPLREGPVLAKSFGFCSEYAHDQELIDLINAHADTIITVLSGHLHLTGMVQDHGIYHIVTSGTASYPCDYAVFDVYKDRIHVQMKTLPEKLQTPDTDIHGKPRWEIDYTDAQHPTHDLYMKGTKGERDFNISLNGRKRPSPSK
ncbi:MAG: metallophosphoesterase family protein [Armatimonadota bacterium]